MNEARRAIRYVLPGVVAVAVFVGLCLVVAPGASTTIKFLDQIEASNKALAGALASLVASGAVGYVASQVYFALHWLGPKWLGPTDHTRAAARVREVDGWHEPPSETLDECRSAWATVTVWWFMTKGIDPRIEASTRRTTSLMDHSHSAGIVSVALLMMVATWILFAAIKFGTHWTCILGGTAPVIAFVFLLFSNCYRTRLMFERIVDLMVQQALEVQDQALTTHRKQKDEKPAARPLEPDID